jgi:hypothetical protein
MANNSDDRRVYWGENLLITNYGEDGTVTRLPMGELPAAGGWVRLEVPAADLDLEGETLRGYGLYAYDGRVAFDQIGKSSEPDEPLIEYRISGQVVSDGVGLAGVEMTSAAGAVCTPSDANGDYQLRPSPKAGAAASRRRRRVTASSRRSTGSRTCNRTTPGRISRRRQ